MLSNTSRHVFDIPAEYILACDNFQRSRRKLRNSYHYLVGLHSSRCKREECHLAALFQLVLCEQLRRRSKLLLWPLRRWHTSRHWRLDYDEIRSYGGDHLRHQCRRRGTRHQSSLRLPASRHPFSNSLRRFPDSDWNHQFKSGNGALHKHSTSRNVQRYSLFWHTQYRKLYSCEYIYKYWNVYRPYYCARRCSARCIYLFMGRRRLHKQLILGWWRRICIRIL